MVDCKVAMNLCRWGLQTERIQSVNHRVLSVVVIGDVFQVQMYQLSRLLHDHHKDLYDHFEVNEVAPTLYAAPWFLTIFASQFPIGFVARVFGMLFVVSATFVNCVMKVIREYRGI